MNARMLATQMAITNNWEKEMSLDTWNQTSDSHSKRSHAPTNHWIQMVKMGRKAINKVLIGVEFKLFDFSNSSRYTSTNRKIYRNQICYKSTIFTIRKDSRNRKAWLLRGCATL